MTYSFNVAAPTKEEAKQKIASEFDSVLARLPVHAVDMAAAQAAADAFVDVLSEPAPSEQIWVAVSGSVGWRSVGVRYSNISVSANLSPAPTV